MDPPRDRGGEPLSIQAGPEAPPREAPAGGSATGRLARLREVVACDLFPAAGPARIGAGAVALLALSAIALVTASLLRQTGVGALDTVWAEDGTIFLAQALERSPVDAIATPYAGYLNVLPRLGAEVVALLPLARAATALALAGAAATALAALVVYAATAGHLRSRPLRGMLAAAVVLAPIMAPESLNSMALAQWPLTFAAFWAALWRPARATATVLAGALLLLTMVSAPLAIVLAPVLAVRALVVPRWLDRLPSVLYAAGLAVQAAVVLSQPVGPQIAGTPGQLARAYSILVTTPAVFGFAFAERLQYYLQGATGIFAAVACLAVTAVALRPRAPHRLTVLLAAGTSLAAFVVAVYARGAAPRVVELVEGGIRPDATRFAVVPVLLLLSVLAFALDRWDPSLQTVVIGLLALIAGTDLLLVNDRSNGPAWSTEIAEGVMACRAGADDATLRISPAWQFDVACAELPP